MKIVSTKGTFEPYGIAYSIHVHIGAIWQIRLNDCARQLPPASCQMTEISCDMPFFHNCYCLVLRSRQSPWLFFNSGPI